MDFKAGYSWPKEAAERKLLLKLVLVIAVALGRKIKILASNVGLVFKIFLQFSFPQFVCQTNRVRKNSRIDKDALISLI